MNGLSMLCVAAGLLAASCANPTESSQHSHSASESLRPSKWLTATDLENTPSLDDITLEKLEKMPLKEGSELMQKWYHISQINHKLIPSFVPSPANIPVYIIKSKDEKEISNLNDFVEAAKQDTSFGSAELTIFITGLPSTLETVKKANHELMMAYIERYNHRHEEAEHHISSNIDATSHSSSDEHSTVELNQKINSGNLIVIDLGHTFDSLERLAMLDVDEVGAMIGEALVHLANDCDVPQEIIHVVAQGVAAHVAGAAGDEYNHLTDHKLRRITALDPSKILSKNPYVLSGLARGDAEFVDAIHSSVYGMGTLTAVGDIDFYPNGPCSGVPGAENVIEASMRATRYFAESVRPGNERNFPAMEANSLKQYKSMNGFGKRAFMGIATDYDLKGDYMLLVNEKSPFGMRGTTPKQNIYYGNHDGWRHHKD